MQINEKIAVLRKNKGLKQQDLADSLCVSRQAVQKWESGKTSPDISKLRELASLLGVTVDFLLDENEFVELSKSEDQEESAAIDDKDKKQKIGLNETEGKIRSSKIKSIKAWTIVGAVLTPIWIGSGVFKGTASNFSWMFLIMYLITIPLGIFAIRCVKKANSKNDTIVLGVLTLIFVSIIAGVLILVLPDSFFAAKPAFLEKTPVAIKPVEEKKSVEEENPAIAKPKCTKVKWNKKKLILVSSMSFLAVVGITLAIALPLTLNSGGVSTYFQSAKPPTERATLFNKIADYLEYTKVSDNVFGDKTIKTETFDDIGSVITKVSCYTKTGYDGIEPYKLKVSVSTFVTLENGNTRSTSCYVCVTSDENENEFTGSFDWTNKTKTGTTFVYVFSSARHLSEYTQNDCVNLYNIVVSRNSSDATDDELRTNAVLFACKAMKSGLTGFSDWIKTMFNDPLGAKRFGFNSF